MIGEILALLGLGIGLGLIGIEASSTSSSSTSRTSSTGANADPARWKVVDVGGLVVHGVSIPVPTLEQQNAVRVGDVVGFALIGPEAVDDPQTHDSVMPLVAAQGEVLRAVHQASPAGVAVGPGAVDVRIDAEVPEEATARAGINGTVLMHQVFRVPRELIAGVKPSSPTGV